MDRFWWWWKRAQSRVLTNWCATKIIQNHRLSGMKKVLKSRHSKWCLRSSHPASLDTISSHWDSHLHLLMAHSSHLWMTAIVKALSTPRIYHKCGNYADRAKFLKDDAESRWVVSMLCFSYSFILWYTCSLNEATFMYGKEVACFRLKTEA